MSWGKRIAMRHLISANGLSANSDTKIPEKKKYARAKIHGLILGDVERVKKMKVETPQCRINAKEDAPHLLALVEAAVLYVNTNPLNSRKNKFVYHGRRYPLLFTTLDRVIVCDEFGNQLGASAYSALD